MAVPDATVDGGGGDPGAPARAPWRSVRTPPDEAVPGEGLRARKKRLMRQRISDVATRMFLEQGFDRVSVRRVAEEVGVSEKTVFNYFPTKEALVLDRADALVEGLRAALAARPPGVSPATVVLGLVDEDLDRFGPVVEHARPTMVAFGDMVMATPSLRAARHDIADRMVEAAVEGLGGPVGAAPEDPEVRVAAHALAGLWETYMTSLRRHLVSDAPAPEVLAGTTADVRRAARLLDAGLGGLDAH